MGYTHYFYTTPKLNPLLFKQFAEIVKDLVKDADSIQYECDIVKPVQVTSKLVRFNGKGELGHETFLLQRDAKVSDWSRRKDKAFGFCKTARKPYDEYVTAVLILAKGYFNDDIEVRSDGGIEDWEAGKALASKYFDGKIALTMSEEFGIKIIKE